jgi:phenylpyruvate tautomerase PptA (4-oxalocrotonate tautomerase family)
MPMIDLYATAGTFEDPGSLARDLASTLKAIEQVPDIPMFRENTAAFIHELPRDHISNVDGSAEYVRVQVLTNAGALDRDKQLAAVAALSEVVVRFSGGAVDTSHVWVLLTEAADGGWGLWGRAHTNVELIQAARDEIARLSTGS